MEPEPVKSITPSDILKDDKPKYPTEFFQFQANINNSLQKTLDELQSKYNALSDKFDESRKTTPKRTVTKSKPKPKSKSKPSTPRKSKKVDKSNDDEYEIEYEYVDEPTPQQPVQSQPVQPAPEPQVYVPYIRRKQIDIRDF